MTNTTVTQDVPVATPVISHWIAGHSVEVLPEQTGSVFDPATGQDVARVPRGRAEEVDRAVAAAEAAFPAWRDTALIARSQIFFAFRELVYRHREGMARRITRNHGKTFPDALAEVLRDHRSRLRPAQQKMVTERWPEPGRREELSLVFPGN